MEDSDEFNSKKILIDKRKIGKVSEKGQIHISLNKMFLDKTGLVSGDIVNVFYGNRKIIIVDDMREILKGLEGIDNIPKGFENKKIVEPSILEIDEY
jgi:hypothetical protein